MNETHKRVSFAYRTMAQLVAFVALISGSLTENMDRVISMCIISCQFPIEVGNTRLILSETYALFVPIVTQ